MTLGNRTSDGEKMALVAMDFESQTQWALVAMPAPIYFVLAPFRPLGCARGAWDWAIRT